MAGASTPLVGITGPEGAYQLAWRCASFMLGRAGARCVRLTPSYGSNLGSLDAVVIGGGEDIDPGLYVATGRASGSGDAARDAFEQRVIAHALQRGLPILGICRGAQLLNVMLGGDLHQDIGHLRHHTHRRATVLPRTTVTVDRDSRLRDILAVSSMRVNSLHHQAVDRVGEGLRVVARDRDAIVQALESTGTEFRVGVQWHPEYLPYRREQRRLFQALVAAARD
jgi:putative glutamine amidotransferase